VSYHCTLIVVIFIRSLIVFKKKKKDKTDKNEIFSKRGFPLALAPLPPQAELIWILRLEKALKVRRKKK
jgi:hypothetical protein